MRSRASLTGGALLGALAIDGLVGDPRHLHPVAGFGRVAGAAERAVYRPTRAAGAAYAGVLVAAPTLATVVLQRRLGPGGRSVLLTAVLVTAIGGRTLRRTATQLAAALDAGDLDAARALARSLVSRRPDELGAPELARAAVESVAENTADATIGPLLYAALAGAPGVVAHRAANTLDAMVGYRTERYERFGWAAARLDDALNWPVARVAAGATVAAAALTGEDARAALAIWRRDGARHPSPNAGRAEAAFAGALGVRLGGRNPYPGGVAERPPLGDGQAPGSADVRRAARLSAATAWVAAAGLAALTAQRRRARRPGPFAEVSDAGV